MTKQLKTSLPVAEKKAPLVVPQEAYTIQKDIIDRLKKLVHRGYVTCLCKGFKQDYARILNLFEKYQHTVIQSNPYLLNCKKGCGVCCFHWAEDTYSFEVKILAEHIQTNRIKEIPVLKKILVEDGIWLARIKTAVSRSLEKPHYKKDLGTSDPYDIVLSGFYQLERPCPLLGPGGACSVYSLRPLTCRIYVSFSHPKYCKPENINEGKADTYLLDLEKDASDLFDELHFMYDTSDGDTGLRSILLNQLSKAPGA